MIPYYNDTLLQWYFTTMIPYYNDTLLQFYLTTMISYNSQFLLISYNSQFLWAELHYTVADYIENCIILENYHQADNVGYFGFTEILVFVLPPAIIISSWIGVLMKMIGQWSGKSCNISIFIRLVIITSSLISLIHGYMAIVVKYNQRRFHSPVYFWVSLYK